MKDMNLKVGDRVSFLGLKGTVNKINWDNFRYPVEVLLDDTSTHSFTLFGQYYSGQYPALKRLVKKKEKK